MEKCERCSVARGSVRESVPGNCLLKTSLKSHNQNGQQLVVKCHDGNYDKFMTFYDALFPFYAWRTNYGNYHYVFPFVGKCLDICHIVS